MKRCTKWLTWIALGSAMEAHAIRNEARLRKLEIATPGINPPPTLSAFIRWVFQTDTKVGRVVFCLACVATMGWLGPHILNGKETL